MPPPPTESASTGAAPPEVPERVGWNTLHLAAKLILIAFILANLGGAMFYDQIAVYLTDEQHASIQQVGLFLVYAALMQSLLRFLCGWISDAIGHFRGIAVGSIIGTLGALFLWLAPTWPLTMVAYTFSLAGMAMVGPSATAALAELTPPAIRARTFGITSGLFQIVNVTGPVIGGWIIGVYGWKTVLALNALLILAATVLRTRIARFETAEMQRPRWGGLKRDLRWLLGAVAAGSTLGIMLGLDILADFQVGMTFPIRSLFLDEVRKLGPELRGLLFTITGLAAMPAMFLGGWMGDRFGELRTIALALLCGLAGYALFPLLPGFAGLAAAFALWGLMQGLFEPTYRSLISKVVPKRRLATTMGALIGSTNLISFPAAYLGPLLYETVDPATPFLIAAGAEAVLLIGLLCFLGPLSRRIQTEVAEVQERGMD